MEQPVKLPLDVLQSYLQQDVIKLCSKKNIESFKGYLLFIEKVDYFYNTKKRNNTYNKTFTNIIFFSKLYL